MVDHMRGVWQQLRWYPQGCHFEDDYRYIQSMAVRLIQLNKRRSEAAHKPKQLQG